MLYDFINKLRPDNHNPRHEYNGELIHYVRIKDCETRHLETKQRYIVTSLEKRKDLSIIHIYYNGKRISGKRVKNDSPLWNESLSFMDWLVMKIKLREIE